MTTTSARYEFILTYTPTGYRKTRIARTTREALLDHASDGRTAAEIRERAKEVDEGLWTAKRGREILSRSAAKAQAHRESHMYRQGAGWIVSTWDDSVRCNRTSTQMVYWLARQTLADWRRRRADSLSGVES